MGFVAKFFLWCLTAFRVKLLRLLDRDILDLNMATSVLSDEKEQ